MFARLAAANVAPLATVNGNHDIRLGGEFAACARENGSGCSTRSRWRWPGSRSPVSRSSRGAAPPQYLGRYGNSAGDAGLVVVASHFPVLSEASRVAAAGLPYAGDLVNRADLEGGLRSDPRPKVVLSGHIHARCSTHDGTLLQFTAGALIEPPFDASILEIDGTSVRRTARRLGEIAVTDPVFAADDEGWGWSGGGGRHGVITDVHTHVGEYPLHISEKFAAEARAAWPDVPLGGSLDDHYGDALADVDRAVVLAFNAPAAGFVVPNDYVAAYVARDPARLIGFGAVDPSSGSAVDELERMKSDLGLVGCKLGPIYQNVDPLGPDFLRVCEALERLELPMLIHQGTTFARAGSLLQARPILLDEIALRYPKLKIVIAHLGHPWFDEAIAVVRRHPHVYADISALVSRRWLLYQALVSAIEYRVEHKLLFGTDFPFLPRSRRSTGCDRSRAPAFGPRHAGGRRAGRRGHHPPAQLELLEITPQS